MLQPQFSILGRAETLYYTNHHRSFNLEMDHYKNNNNKKNIIMGAATTMFHCLEDHPS
jgi:hypothetical protein